MPPENPLLILHGLSGTPIPRLAMLFPAIAGREGCFPKAKCAWDIGVVSCKWQAAKGINFLFRLPLYCMQSVPLLFFINTSPVLNPFALLYSLALRIGAGIKRCHRGFTINLQPLAGTFLSQTAISVQMANTALQLIRL